jgi:hypothetical protein
MRWTARLLPALLLAATLCGCSRTPRADSEPPPGVVKNPDRKKDVSTKKMLLPPEK